MYVDKAEENIKQHLNVTSLEDGEGITRYNSEVTVDNDRRVPGLGGTLLVGL